jgi:hypothetical protein
MTPRPFRLEAASEPAGIARRHAAAPASSAGREFKVLLSSRAPTQLPLALASSAPDAKGFRTR